MKPGDIVFYDDNQLTVDEGPFTTVDTPGVKQVICRARNGFRQQLWVSDLLTEQEWRELRDW